jgi:hypothetical protein
LGQRATGVITLLQQSHQLPGEIIGIHYMKNFKMAIFSP